MKTTSFVPAAPTQLVDAPNKLLEACWMLVDQEMMLDVAATIAATQPDINTPAVKSLEASSTLAIQWTAREPKLTRTV